jgi:cyclic pyranopterin phosphate synthase
MDFTHFDEKGNAIMVDVSSKDTTQRSAIAYGEIYVGQEILEKIENHQMKKGDVLSVARIAGIMAVKKTSDIIPLCHPLLLSKITVDFHINHEKELIETYCQVTCLGKTGVEMEALHGVSATLLTIYDMCKAIDKGMVISDVHLVKKSGGKSGDFYFNEEK